MSPTNKPPDTRTWWVYVIQSQMPRFSKTGKRLPGVHYVGSSVDVLRRLRQHNGELVGGSKYTSQHQPWILMAVFGSYIGQSDALKAEYTLKRTKRGVARTLWAPTDSTWCRGLGVADPRVQEARGANPLCISVKDKK